jgi:hypothetical protein
MEGEGVYERLMDEAAKKYLATGEIERGNLYNLACAAVDPRGLDAKTAEKSRALIGGLTTSEIITLCDSLKLAKERLTLLLVEKENNKEATHE